MSTLAFFILIVVLFGLFAIGALALLYQLLTNFQPSQNKVQADLKMLKEELANWSAELIPWKEEELELLSINQTNKTTKKRLMTSITKGMFTSIYHEPMVAYAYKKYVASSDTQNAILYACTAHHEFVYRFKKHEVEVSLDGKSIGILNKNGALYGKQSNRLLAQISQQEVDGLLPLRVGDRELASIPANSANTNSTTRALQFLEDGLNKDEQLVLLSLTVLEMVNRDFSQ